MIAKFGIFTLIANKKAIKVMDIEFPITDGEICPSNMETLLEYDQDPTMIVLPGNPSALKIWTGAHITKVVKRAWFSQ